MRSSMRFISLFILQLISKNGAQIGKLLLKAIISSNITALEKGYQATKVAATKGAKSTFVDFKKLYEPAKALCGRVRQDQ